VSPLDSKTEPTRGGAAEGEADGHEAATSLREREAQYRETFERAPIGLALVGLDGRWLQFNRRMAEIVGHTDEELRQLTFQDITFPPDLPADIAQVQRLRAGEIDSYRMEKRYVRNDGSLVWAMLHASLVRGTDGAPRFYVAVVEDISARKAIDAERTQLAAIVECSDDAILTKSIDDGRILSWNSTAERMLGYAASEIIGQPAIVLIPTDRQHEESAILERVRRGERVAPYDTVRLRKDGIPVAVSLSVASVPDEHGRPVAAATILRDIAERQRIEAELAAAKEAAEASDRAKGQFLATMSHEIRTPLNAILGYVDLLELGVSGALAEQQREYLERMRRSGRHLLAVINQVLDLARIEADRLPLRLVDANLGDTVEGALTLVEPQAARRGLQILNACGPTRASWYAGDPDRVQQILVNLLSNAVKFTPAGGRITLTCGSTRLPPRDATLATTAAEWVYVRVEDTGVGIAPERLGAVFEPFEQEQEGAFMRATEGTGLGLTISRRLARAMGGDITVRSEPGVGSAFFLWLPASQVHTPAERDRAPDRRAAARYSSGLGAIGDLALEGLEQVVAAYVARLRADPQIPSAARCTDEQLEDHVVTFLADVGQCLTLVEAARGAPSDLVRAGTTIQRIISEHHGAQRARLGFSADEVRREFSILAEELSAAVRRRAESAHGPALDQALELMRRLLEHGERAALRGHRDELARV
jgi:PAS domain S-box-containing protein